MSSLKDLASLIMVPSLVKDGRLDTVKPLGNSIIHPDATGNNDGTDGSTPAEGNFTFSRGSNLAATRLDVNGLIEKGRENLLLQSNSFSTSPFVTSNVSLTSGQSGYDGTNDAWELSTTGVNGFENLYQNISFTGVHTISIYAKAGSNAYLTIRSLTSDFRVQFKLDDGTHSATFGSPINTFMEDAGAGWYRCGFTANFSSASSWVFYPQRIGITDAGNIYIQDAQLESSMVATDYIETGASTAQAGILEDLPRLDYSASCPSLLLESQRTNQVTNSEYVSSSDYVVGNWTGTITTNTTETTSPEGVYNATKYVKSGASDRVYFHSSQPDGAYTGSVWLKAASGSENTTIEISVRRFGGGGGSTSKLVTITNEWQRFDVTATNLTGGTTTAMYVADFSMGGTATEFYSYGMQIEAGSYPTSYIPTYGSAVTRTDEFFYNYDDLQANGILGSTWTFMYDQTYQDVVRDAACAVFLLDNGNSGGDGLTNVRVALNSNGSFRLQDSSGQQYASTGNKILCRYDGSKISWYIDGSLLNEHNITGAFDTLNRHNPSGSNKKTIRLNQVLIFPTALTDSECIALTTL